MNSASCPPAAVPERVSIPQPLPAVPSNQLSIWALVLCAGEGQRAVPAPLPHSPVSQRKQYQALAGLPMVLHTLAAFVGVQRLRSTLVAVARDDVFFLSYPSSDYFVVPCGGPTRADTVLGGLLALTERGAAPNDWVLVHDAARCLVTTAQINALVDACAGDRVGGLLAHKLADTLKAATSGPGGMRVVSTLDRSDKWLAQTPQMFRLGLLTQALQQFGSAATDEASAMESLGERPLLVPGSALNFKVTYPEDFALAEALLLQRTHTGTLARFSGSGAGPTPARTICTTKQGEL